MQLQHQYKLLLHETFPEKGNHQGQLIEKCHPNLFVYSKYANKQKNERNFRVHH